MMGTLRDTTIRHRPSRERRFKKISFVLLLVAFVMLCDVLFFCFAPYKLLCPVQSPLVMEKGDVAAILFNDFNENKTGINNETTRRVNHGITLLQQGKVRHLIMAGGYRSEVKKCGSTLMAEYAFKAGVPRALLLVDNTSHDSVGNMANIRTIMDANDWHDLVLVSSPHHLARIKRIGVLPGDKNVAFSPYDPLSCRPAITRFELWRSVHKNFIAELLYLIMPEGLYRNFVAWVRENTDF